MSCSASSSTVRAALRTALTVQQRRHVYSWARRTTSSATTTTTTRGEAALAAVSGCSARPQLISMSTTTNRISGDSSSSASSPPASTLPRAFPADNQPQKGHEQQQKPSDTSMQSTPPSSSSTSSSQRSRYLLREMSRDDLEQIPNNSIHLLQDLVQQLEEDWSILTTRDDVSLVVRPLLNTCLRMIPREAAADLAERILFACLARLPPSVADRYHPNNHHHTSPHPPPPSAISNSDNTTCITTSSSTNGTTSYPYPDADIYGKVMLACGHLRTLAAAERVHRLFRLMMSEYRAEVQYLTTTATTRPTQASLSTKRMVVPQAPAPRMQTFKTLLRAYAVSGTLQGALHAHEILNVMENLSGSSSSQSVSSRAVDAACKGRSSLDRLGDGATSSNNSISGTTTSMIEGVSLRLDKPPDLACYNAVLNAYAKCLSIQDYHHDHPLLWKRVRILWQRMNDLQQEQWLKYEPNKNTDYFQLDWFSYYPMLRIYHNHVLALFQQEPRNAQGPSHEPLRRPSFCILYDDRKNNHAIIEHDTLLQEIRNLVVALAQTTTIPATVPRCYRVLSRRLDDTQHEQHHPITWAYQVLVQALLVPRQQGNHAHDKMKSSDNDLLELERIQQAHAIVMALAGQRVDGLDTTLCPVYSNDDDAEDDIIWPSQDVILDVIQAWERLALALKKSGPGGRVATAAAVAAAVAAIPERVQQLVKVAVSAPYKSLQDFHQAIDYWGTKSQWKNAPFVNQAILQRLLRENHCANYSEIGVLIPTSQTFAMVMWFWMESQSPHAPSKIEWLFDQLISLYERTHSDRHLPNGTHVDLLLSSWIRHCPSGARFDGKSGTQLLAAQHVTGLVKWLDMPPMGSCGHAWKNRLLRARHFRIALKAWARQRIHKKSVGANGRQPDQAHEAFTLWKHLVDNTNSIPPPTCCNDVLEACVNASVEAQTIYLSGNGDEGDDDEREKKRRQGHYKIAMHVYHQMRDHEVKNKGKHDKHRVKRDTSSYVLILQAWKQTLTALPNQAINDHIQFVQEIMEDCCAEGLLTQALCFEIVEFLILLAKDDSLAKTTLGRLFGVSESAAVAVLQAARVNLIRETKASKLLWQGPNKPSEILLENLPSAWTRNTSFGKAWQEMQKSSTWTAKL